ncbi:hypothetical protein LJR289_001173 [Pseudoduganella sp. LjRoot289]|uniref:hypothetical protein n=1 Tax=Pseudoduganella sp. LjRoot289 TaxID=3342314 RepID=UPI003ECF4D6F
MKRRRTTGNLQSARRACTAAVLFAAALAAGCSRSEHWQEEVRLASGQVIMVQRQSSDSAASIRFFLPGQPGQPIVWHSLHDGGPLHMENPVVLDVENGVAVIYTVVSTSPGCRLFTKYSNSGAGWREEVLPDRFKGRDMNLFILSGLDIGDIVTLDQKRRESSAISYSRSLRFLGPADKACAS